MTVVSVPVIKLWGEKSLCCLARRPCDLMQYILIMGYKPMKSTSSSLTVMKPPQLLKQFFLLFLTSSYLTISVLVFEFVKSSCVTPQDQFAVFQRCPGTASLLQKHHVLVQSQIKSPVNRD